MFDGVPADQFHQFLVSSRTSLPIPLSFPLHHHHGIQSSAQAQAPAPAPASVPPPPITPTPTFLGCFDPYPSPQTLELQPHNHHHHNQSGLHHQLHHQSQRNPTTTTTTTNSNKNIHDDEKGEANSGMFSRNLEIEREGSISAPTPSDPWSNDEVLALLRIRSSMESWFPEFTWEHVSRKLAELGYHRSADKCKEKFEEESRHFNSMSYNKNYRFFSDLDELYHDGNPQISTEKTQDLSKENDKQEGDNKMDPSLQEEGAENIAVANPSDQENAELVKEPVKSRKRKRKHKFEMFKGFCEAVVKKIVEQQEELHNKLIEDMVKRDEESIAREEAWKCQEIDRINKEIEMRAHEQAIACDRQAKIIELLKKFTSGSHEDQSLMRRIEALLKVTNSSSSVTSSSENLPPSSLSDQRKLEVVTSSSKIIPHQNPTLLPSQNNPSLPTSSSETTPSPQNHCSTVQKTFSPTQAIMSFQNPHNNSNNSHENPLVSTPSAAQKSSQQMVSAPNERSERIAGKRWPRDEVQALINLKCSLTNNSDDNKDGAKGPLWERISQRMQDLGYKRNSKRCKEKWENINKYFRKTKDNNKKRSLDSRTCPYFHQLSTLYSQGTLVAPSDVQENRQASPENHYTSMQNNSR